MNRRNAQFSGCLRTSGIFTRASTAEEITALGEVGQEGSPVRRPDSWRRYPLSPGAGGPKLDPASDPPGLTKMIDHLGEWR